MRTFSGIIEIMLMGNVNLGGYTLYPVYYAPQGGSNLISASQLEDHSLRSYQKKQTIIMKSGNRIVQTFPRKGNLYVSQFQHSTNSIIEDPTATTTSRDWHSCKIKASPHNHPIPSTNLPFQKLHFDILEITPLAKSSIRYVLVIIDDFSRFNRVYLLNRKLQAELKVMSYVHKIQNKTQRCPGFLHTDQGGEFYSASFRSKAEALGMVFERGPANSPQTNGIAERFNQTLLTKCWCLLAQSNVPICFWDEAVKFSSTLINLLPSRSLNWKSPVSVLLDLKSNIGPVHSLNSLIPFGLKAFVHRQSESKVLPPSKLLLYLGPEDYSDASQFLDPQTDKVIVSRDYTTVPFKFDYTTSGSLKKPVEGLPCTTTNNSSSAHPLKSQSYPHGRVRTTFRPLPQPFQMTGVLQLPSHPVNQQLLSTLNPIRPLMNHAPLSAHHPVSHFLIKRDMLTFHTITMPRKTSTVTSTETILLWNLEDKGMYLRL
ncbi:hypothetical protein O181_078118 [Austropuccinia psidii MF-1]|uniref:Integrase catalytic domain-containing protein n=1 Tax=Austropuccinia psidii MF-1 TaxID=1389203 RepID=A0A9Q3IEC3_9BASI|nr:hypothetical protein [Austropuccinia psidii MF-1]